MEFGKFELILATFGFIKFTKAASKFKQMSTDFAAVPIKKVQIWLPAYKFDSRAKFDKILANFSEAVYRAARQI